MDAALLARHIIGKASQSKQRLQFPVATQQRKHFDYLKGDQFHFGDEEKQYFRLVRPNKLDISDIEGAKPRNCHAVSQKRLHILDSELMTTQIKDSLDQFDRRSVHKRDLSLKQLRRSKQAFRPAQREQNLALPDIKQEKDRVLCKHLKTEPVGSDFLNKFKIVDPEKSDGRLWEKKSILQNPTYLSSLFL